ncbi:alpha/beta fold hydrolase [Streptomyces sp. NBC_00391]|uniref:alpha/beta fold hydrolase n=1 Tax=Streptomyces sp. NBC_00391 TaxID=2903647 RepID=UPI002E1F5ACE
MASSRIGVVFVHGLFSSPKTWDTIAGLLARDESMLFVSAQRFHYASPKFRLRPDRRIPDFNDIADQLKSFLSTRAKEYDRLVLVAHSQGGLVVQRYLSRMIAQGKGQELARIGGVVLFACPNDGSSFALSLRTSWLQRNPQEGELRPLADQVKDAQRTVINQIVNATTTGPSTCRIPFWVYGGTEDKVVVRASAQGSFPEVAMLPGDHFSIIEPESHQGDAYLVLREHLLDVQNHEGSPTLAAPPTDSPTPVSRPSPTHPGDRARAARIISVLPPHADWLTTLRNQDFFVVSGRVNRLFHGAVDAMTNDRVWFVDPELRDAETVCRTDAANLSGAMIDLLFADRVDYEAMKRLPVAQSEDAWRFVLGEHERGKSELRLHRLRDAFFQTYDVLVRLLNERLLLPGQAASPTAPGTSAIVVEGDEVRAAGTGAHHNAFGDRSSVNGDAPTLSAADERTVGETVIRGSRNRVAGPGAHDNAFGDDSHVHKP